MTSMDLVVAILESLLSIVPPYARKMWISEREKPLQLSIVRTGFRSPIPSRRFPAIPSSPSHNAATRALLYPHQEGVEGERHRVASSETLHRSSPTLLNKYGDQRLLKRMEDSCKERARQRRDVLPPLPVPRRDDGASFATAHRLQSCRITPSPSACSSVPLTLQ